ncbi:MAG: PepSY domain-containing protein [Emticicia sp.]|nr:PepSY domain-containing protein [Emticicia sp.]
MNNKFKRLLFSIHSWFGLITGIFMLLLGLSGSILIFKDDLDELIYRKSLIVKPEAKALPIDSLYKIITNKYKNLDGIAWINPMAEKDQSYHFRFYLNDARIESYDLGAMNINQYTGEILRSWPSR